MLNRRHIRVKVMQTLYAFDGSESDDLSKDQKFLLYSIDSMYNQYLLSLTLMVEVQKRAENYINKAQQKHLATDEEKNPNRKFINNEVLYAIRVNPALEAKVEDLNVKNWDLDSEYVDVMYKDLLASDFYKEYMATTTSTFKEDRDFALRFFKEIVAPNEKYHDYLEDQNLTWIDDLAIVNSAIVRVLERVKPNSLDVHFTPRLYKDNDDKQFAIDLFRKTLLNQNSFKGQLEGRSDNWDIDRVSNIDLILLTMAFCEIEKFPSIPTKVTINEYLEIAKEYSTPKSRIFINGILDKLVKEYESEGKLNKIGRGLM